MAAAGQGATGLTFWNKVYGFDYSLVQQELREDAHQTALLKDVSNQDMLSNSCQLRQLDIAHMTTADASFSTDFVLEPTPEVSEQCGLQLGEVDMCRLVFSVPAFAEQPVLSFWTTSLLMNSSLSWEP